MSGPIYFDPEVYGTYARRSAMADWLELLVLNLGGKMRNAQVADWIEQNQWEALFGPHFAPVGTTATRPDAETAANAVFDLLAERADTLGELYPFDVDLHQVSRRASEERHEPYLLLLGIATAHAFDLDTHDPRILFEAAVERAMGGRIGLATTFRRHRETEDGFHAALLATAAAVNLRGIPSATVSLSAQDEGLDVLAHTDWGDLRRGRWVFVGQATVAKSDRWQEKVTEARPVQWRDLLEEALNPLGFLAVPHHIEPDHWQDLLYHDRVLLDRLRLVPWLGTLTQMEQTLVADVSALSLEPLFP